MLKIKKVIAKASLADTLLKLNTGLVGIISSFLGDGSGGGNGGKKDVNLDYDKLTTISNEAQSETLAALSDLYQRLSTSNLAIMEAKPSPGTTSSANATKASKGGKAHPKTFGDGDGSGDGRGGSSRKKPTNTITIAKIRTKNSSVKQLAVIRSRDRRKTSVSSSKSGTSASSSKMAQNASTASTAATVPEPSSAQLQACPKLTSQPVEPVSSRNDFQLPSDKKGEAFNHDREKRKHSKAKVEPLRRRYHTQTTQAQMPQKKLHRYQSHHSLHKSRQRH